MSSSVSIEQTLICWVFNCEFCGFCNEQVNTVGLVVSAGTSDAPACRRHEGTGVSVRFSMVSVQSGSSIPPSKHSQAPGYLPCSGGCWLLAKSL